MKTRLFIALFAVLSIAAFGQANPFAWEKTWELSGKGTELTQLIRLYNNKWTLTYKTADKKPLDITLIDAKTGKRFILSDTKGRTTRGGNMSSYTIRGNVVAEQAYLFVRGPEAGWSMVFEQYIDLTDQWRFHKATTRPPKLSPYGSWTGAASDTSVVIGITKPAVRLSFTQIGEGRIHYQIISAEGDVVATGITTKDNETRQTWLHAMGDYTLQLDAVNASWKLHADVQEQKK